MAEKNLLARMKLRHDSLANWTAINPILQAGEIAVVTIPAGVEDSTLNNIPNVVLKVGDGVNPFNSLPYVTGLAGDVYAWAKSPNKPVYEASEIANLEETVSRYVQDTNTTYSFRHDAENHKWVLQSREIGVTDFADVTPEVSIDLSEIYEIVQGGAVADQINDAISALDVEDNVVEKQFVTSVSETNGKISVTRAQPTITDINGLSEALSNINGAMHFYGKIEGATFEQAIAAVVDHTFASGDVVLYGYDEYVYDGQNWHALGNENIYATINSVNEKIGNLKYTDAAETNQFVQAVSQTNGKISVTKGTLSKLASTASTDDLVQGDLTLVLDGGTAFTVFD